MITMISRFVFVGADEDLPKLKTQPAILHAAKEPWHRQMLGYITPGAPKENPEYLIAVRHYYNECAMNLIDTDDPAFVPKELMDSAVNFVNFHRCKFNKVFIHCNQGLSRAPTIAMLVTAPALSIDFDEAMEQFMALCPTYAPRNGMLEFARQNWSFYHGEGR